LMSFGGSAGPSREPREGSPPPRGAPDGLHAALIDRRGAGLATVSGSGGWEQEGGAVGSSGLRGVGLGELE
jgi:hypothetical protein